MSVFNRSLSIYITTEEHSALLAKRQNRLKPIDHERRQLENLKTLTPLSTPEQARPLSDMLIDIAVAALDEVYALEAGEPPKASRLQHLRELVSSLPTTLDT